MNTTIAGRALLGSRKELEELALSALPAFGVEISDADPRVALFFQSRWDILFKPKKDSNKNPIGVDLLLTDDERKEFLHSLEFRSFCYRVANHAPPLEDEVYLAAERLGLQAAAYRRIFFEDDAVWARKVLRLVDVALAQAVKSSRMQFRDTLSKIMYLEMRCQVEGAPYPHLYSSRHYLNGIAQGGLLFGARRDDLIYATAMLCRFILGITSEADILPPPDAEVVNFSPSFTAKKSRRDAAVPFIRLLVQSVKSGKYKDEGVVELAGLAVAGDRVGKCSVRLANVDKEFADDISNLIAEGASMTRPLSVLHITHLEPVKGKVGHFQSTYQTLAILEPEYLFSSTAIAECFGYYNESPNAYKWLAKLFLPQSQTYQMLRGIIVNKLFDDLVRAKAEGRHYDREQAKASVEASYILELSALDPGVAEAVLEEVFAVHWPELVAITEDIDAAYADLEPTLISPLYGLDGRLDMIQRHADDPLHIDILELKSGKPPGHGQSPTPEHSIQVGTYAALLQSQVPGWRGESNLIFSRSRDKKFNIGVYRIIIGGAIVMRNRLVVLFQKLREGNAAFLLGKLTPAAVPDTFMRGPLAELSAALHNADGATVEYFVQNAALIAEEWAIEKVGSSDDDRNGGIASLWRERDIEQKVERQSILNNLVFCGVEGREYVFRKTEATAPISSFREGDIAIVYSDEVSDNPTRQPILRVTVASLRSEEVRLVLWSNLVKRELFREGDIWHLEPAYLEHSYRHLFANLSRFVLSDHRRRAVWLGVERPRAGTPLPDRVVSADAATQLSSHQREVVARAVAAEEIFLIQGPPGTGKTSTVLMSIVATLLASTDDTVTVAAFTNRAVDEIAHHLERCGIPYWHLTSPSDPNTRRHSIREVKRHAQGRDKVKEVLASRRVYVTTISAFLASYSLYSSLLRFERLIVDEASQITEPLACGLVGRCRSAILIGDHRQLPPIARAAAAEVDSGEPAPSYVAGVSPFERLFEAYGSRGWSDSFASLSEHYRMHAQLVKLINANYGGRLTVELVRQHAARPPVSPDITGAVLRATLLRGRVAFIDIPSEQTIKINRVEAEMAAEIAQELCEAGVAPGNIGIITPWRAQIAAVRVALRARGVPDDVAVDTVERFQGSERDYIVISTCVANKYLLSRASSPSLDTKVDRKLNVALSRAREAVWILGNSAVLSESAHWHSILAHCRREGIWLRKSAR